MTNTLLDPDRFTAAHQPLATTTVRAFLGSRKRLGPHERNDLVNIVLLRWWENRHAFRPGGSASLKTWQRTVAWNCLLDLLAAEQTQMRSRMSAVSLDESISEESDVLRHEVVGDDRAGSDVELLVIRSLRREQIELLRSYLGAGDARLLDALLEDHRVRPASRAAGVPPSTTYGRIAVIAQVAEDLGLRAWL